MKLEDLRLFRHPAGFQHRELFDNGYGISVIPEGDGKTYELAVLQHENGRREHLCYETEVTDDVIRYATVNAVHAIRERVMGLPKTTTNPPYMGLRVVGCFVSLQHGATG